MIKQEELRSCENRRNIAREVGVTRLIPREKICDSQGHWPWVTLQRWSTQAKGTCYVVEGLVTSLVSMSSRNE